MRFAVIATAAAAAIAVPMAVSASGPQMSSDEFLTAVRCVAYEDITQPNAQLAEAKWQLNAEALHQSAETAAEARAVVSSVAREAVQAETAALRQESAIACAAAQLAGSPDSRQGA